MEAHLSEPTQFVLMVSHVEHKGIKFLDQWLSKASVKHLACIISRKVTIL